MHRLWHIRLLLLTVLLCLTAGLPPARAATIEVEVRERESRPVDGLRVSLIPRQPDNPRARFRHRGQTGADGKLRFTEVEPGSYTFDLGRPGDPDLLLPADNPWVEMPVVTLPNEEAEVSITIELWRGVPLVLDLRALHSDLPTSKIVLTHVETGERVEYKTGPAHGSEKRFERAMVEGRWQLRYEPPPGFVINELTVNGEAIPGGVAEVDSSIDPRTQYIYWELSSPCEVWGRVLPPGSGIGVNAMLLEPGPWAEAELARGRRHDLVRPFRWEHPSEFHIRLPEGVWRIEPYGDRLEESEPTHVDLRLLAGEVRRQDFEVTASDAEGQPVLTISVVTPGDRAPVPDAQVALYRAGDVGLQEPLATQRTGGKEVPRYRRGQVRFRGLEKGEYEIVAGHPEWLDGRRVVAFDPENKEGTTRATVQLVDGATIRAHAFDHLDESAVSKVEVTLEWLGDEFPSVLDDPQLDAARRNRMVRSDLTGYAIATGLAEGSYRIEARVTGEQQMTHYARVRLPGAAEHESLDVDVLPPAEYAVELPVYSGSSIVGRLRCDDEGPLPPAASFLVYRASEPWGGIELGPHSESVPLISLADRDGEIELPGQPDAELDLEKVLLDGRYLDQFTVGPLDPGDYVLAIRPEGYEPWSWAYASDLRREAVLLALPQEQTTDVGSVDALCGPAVIVRPSILSGAAVPDMRLGQYEVTATVRRDTGDEVAVSPSVEARQGHLLIRGLEAGATELTLEIHHPHLIPSRVTHRSSTIDLERGTRPTERTPFSDVGGALVVRTEAPAVSLMLEGLPTTTAAVERGQARLTGIAPGNYRLLACRDVACANLEARALDVQIEAHRTRNVDF